MSVDHLNHWLIGAHALEGEAAICPWSPFEGNLWNERPRLVSAPAQQLWDDLEDADGKPLPLLSPVRSSASYVEAALHKDKIRKALLHQAVELRRQTLQLVQERRTEAIAAQERLMASWKSGPAAEPLAQPESKDNDNDPI